MVFIVSPFPKFITFPCCDQLDHMINSGSEDYLQSIISDLICSYNFLRKKLGPIIISIMKCTGKTIQYNFTRAKAAITEGRSKDLLHLSHVCAKMALNLSKHISLAKKKKSAALPAPLSRYRISDVCADLPTTADGGRSNTSGPASHQASRGRGNWMPISSQPPENVSSSLSQLQIQRW
jgi:hypothetical protein